MKHSLRLLRVSALIPLLACGGSAAAFAAPSSVDKAGPPQRVRVRCERGETIARALERTAGRVIVEFSGRCREDLDIQRDGLTLRGVGGGAVFEGEIFVTNSQGTVIEGFTVEKSRQNCIEVRYNSHVLLQNLVAQECTLSGILVTDSSAEIRNVSALRNLNGISLLRTSNGSFLDRVRAQENRVGMIFAIGTGYNAVDRRNLTQFDIDTSNNEIGIILQNGVSISIWDGIWRSNHNRLAGFVLVGNASVVESETTLEVNGNGFAGGLLRDSAAWMSSAGTGVRRSFHDNGVFGLRAEANANLDFDGALLSLHGNGSVGLSIDNATAILEGVSAGGHPGGDIAIGFGSRVTFLGSNTVGTVACDGTSLVRGPVACGSSLAQLAVANDYEAHKEARAEIERVLREALGAF